MIGAELKIDLDNSSDQFTPQLDPKRKPRVQFTDIMKWYYSLFKKEDFEKAFQLGEIKESPSEFRLTIRTEDVDKIHSEADHQAGITDMVEAPKLYYSTNSI